MTVLEFRAWLSYRWAHGEQLSTIAGTLGVSVNAVWKWIYGETVPGGPVLRLAAALTQYSQVTE